MGDIYAIKIPAFEAGMRTDSAGRQREWPVDELDRIIEIYNAKAAESKAFWAPICKGHPKHDSPSFGWINRFKRVGKRLVADGIRKLSDEFLASLRRGEYMKVSMAFWPPDHPSNPVPGVRFPRHLGFLGAESPAVTLPVPEYEAEEESAEVFEFEFEFAACVDDEGRPSSMEEGTSKSDSIDDSTHSAMADDKTTDEGKIPTASGNDKSEAVQLAEYRAALEAEYRTKTDALGQERQALEQERQKLGQEQQQLEQERAEFTAQQTEFEAQVSAHAAAQQEFKQQQTRARLEKAADEFRVAAGEVDSLLEFALSLDDGEIHQFAAGDGDEKVSQFEAYIQGIEKRPPLTGKQEIIKPSEDPRQLEVEEFEFAAAEGLAVDSEQLKIHNAAMTLIASAAEKKQELSYAAAIEQVVRGK